MNNAKYFIPLFVLILLIPSSLVYAESTGVDDKTNNENPHTLGDTTGSVGNTLLDITTLESYKIHPEITEEMLEVLPGEKALTLDFGVAYDELNLIGFGIEEHIREEYVEYLEDLPITIFGKHNNAIRVGIDPEKHDNLDEIRDKFDIMYPNVEIIVVPAFVEYVDNSTNYNDKFTKTSKVNKAIPNGRGSITDTINIAQPATLNSMSVSITVDHEDHDEMYMKLTSPQGKVITVFSRERGHDDGLQTFTYSSSTNSGLARLAGTDIFGTWTLNIRDAYTGNDIGTLKTWTLNFDATPVKTTDGTNTNGTENNEENLIEQLLNIIFGDTKCNTLSDDCVPKVAGSYISYIGRQGAESHSSIGLGGVNTTDGNYGFLIAGHAPGHGDLGKIIAHELVDTNSIVSYTDALGIVSINNNATRSGYLAADVAFVEYPQQCITTEDTLCYGPDNYTPTVKPLEIFKSNGKTYDVTGTDNMSRGESVATIGFASNKLLKGTVYDSFERIPLPDGYYSYMALTTTRTQSGDSGGPVFTIPNSDDEVEFMGINSVSITIGGETYSGVVPWYRIQADLGLQPIS